MFQKRVRHWAAGGGGGGGGGSKIISIPWPI